MNLSDFSTHGNTLLSVQVGQRLVHQEDADLTDDGTANSNTLTLTTGKGSGHTVQVIGQAQDLGNVTNLLVDHVFVNTLQGQAESQVIVNAHLGIQSIALEHHCDLSFTGALVVGIFTVDQELAAADILQACDHTQSGGLAAAGGTNENDEFALFDFQVEIVHCMIAVGINFIYSFQRQVSHNDTPYQTSGYSYDPNSGHLRMATEFQDPCATLPVFATPEEAVTICVVRF